MEYHDKYAKYKRKYLDLKQKKHQNKSGLTNDCLQLGGGNNTVSNLYIGGNSFAIKLGDHIYTWGNNDYGQLGRANSYIDIPMKVNLQGIKDVVLGAHCSAFINNKNELYLSGSLYVSKEKKENVYMPLLFAKNVKKVVMSGTKIFVILSDGTVHVDDGGGFQLTNYAKNVRDIKSNATFTVMVGMKFVDIYYNANSKIHRDFNQDVIFVDIAKNYVLVITHRYTYLIKPYADDIVLNYNGEKIYCNKNYSDFLYIIDSTLYRYDHFQGNSIELVKNVLDVMYLNDSIAILDTNKKLTLHEKVIHNVTHIAKSHDDAFAFVTSHNKIYYNNGNFSFEMTDANSPIFGKLYNCIQWKVNNRNLSRIVTNVNNFKNIFYNSIKGKNNGVFEYKFEYNNGNLNVAFANLREEYIIEDKLNIYDKDIEYKYFVDIISKPTLNIKIVKADNNVYLYDEDNFLGAGSFGAVYKCLKINVANMHEDGVVYAIKHIKTIHRIQSVINEIKILHEVKNQCKSKYLCFEDVLLRYNSTVHTDINKIVKINDTVQHSDDECYVVTQYIKGCSLENYIVNHYRNYDVKKKIVSQLKDVYDNLRALHKKNIYHLDFKPENTMVSSNSKCKLEDAKDPIIVDFGLSKLKLISEIRDSDFGRIGTSVLMYPLLPNRRENLKHLEHRTVLILADIWSFITSLFYVVHNSDFAILFSNECKKNMGNLYIMGNDKKPQRPYNSLYLNIMKINNANINRYMSNVFALLPQKYDYDNQFNELLFDMLKIKDEKEYATLNTNNDFVMHVDKRIKELFNAIVS